MSEATLSAAGLHHAGRHAALQLIDDNGTFLSRLHPDPRGSEIERALKEAVADLDALHEHSLRGVPGGPSVDFSGDLTDGQEALDTDELIIAGQEVMQAWEHKLMHEMARIAARSHGDVLEVGFGMAISANAILAEGVRSYTVIDCNPDVLKRAHAWRAERPEIDIRIVEGRWEETIDTLGEFDGIFFDTYPTTQAEFEQYALDDMFYAQHFAPAAHRHLREGGVFTYFTREIDTIGRVHQRILLERFAKLEISVVRDLQPPADCSYWWADSMAVVAAVK